MSKYSGKCDLCDSVDIYTDGDPEKIQEFVDNSDIYLGNNIVPLRINSEKDLVAFYPYIEGIMAASKDENGIVKRHIVLSTKSFIDEEEEKRLGYKLDYCFKVYRRYKRNKKPFVYSDDLLKECFWYEATECEKEILRRVCDDGLKATTEGIHTFIQDYYREQWYEEMIRVGWDERRAYQWVYGYERYFEKCRKEKANDGSMGI